MTSIPKTQFDDLSLVRQGKVRDIFDTGDSLLMVTTDRLSAFDVVLPDTIPDKGKVLNQISVFWFKQMETIVKNHIITTDVNEYPKEYQQHSKEVVFVCQFLIFPSLFSPDTIYARSGQNYNCFWRLYAN